MTDIKIIDENALIAMGFTPGEHFGSMLNMARAVQKFGGDHNFIKDHLLWQFDQKLGEQND